MTDEECQDVIVGPGTWSGTGGFIESLLIELLIAQVMRARRLSIAADGTLLLVSSLVANSLNAVRELATDYRSGSSAGCGRANPLAATA